MGEPLLRRKLLIADQPFGQRFTTSISSRLEPARAAGPPSSVLDEDAVDGDLVRGLRSPGIYGSTAADAGMIRRKDEEHLSFASMQGRALYSFNVGDFQQIQREWTSTGRGHRSEERRVG